MKPILFSTPMVKAILEGSKSQTRRIVKPQLEIDTQGNLKQGEWLYGQTIDGKPHFENFAAQKCPYGKIGDTLWVRETWTELIGHHVTKNQKYVYKADCSGDDSHRQDYIKAGYPYQWKPSIFMPKEACRLFLQITNIRVERLQDISEADAIAEGIKSFRPVPGDGPAQTMYYHYLKNKWGPSPIHSYQTLWESINGKESWDSNPFVWVITFKRIEKP